MFFRWPTPIMWLKSMPQTLIWLFCAVTICRSTACGQEMPKPIALHPQNPHYFLWRGQPTILITSGEHYGLLLNLDFDYVPYFAELRRHGLNHTRVFVGTYREIPGSFGITDNTLAPHPNRYICPWARSDQAGYFDGGNKFDLQRWDAAYFDRLRDMLEKAREAGIVVELNLFCPMYDDALWAANPMNHVNNVNETEDVPRNEVLTGKHPRLMDVQLAVTSKMVSEVNAFDNLYFEVCNEPYERRTTMEWQHRIVDHIVQTERDLPNQHLISQNIANGEEKIEMPHTAVSIFNFHYCVPPTTVALNFGLNKVIGENETGFRGRCDTLYRTEAWDFLLAGGGLFNNLDYSFSPNHEDGSLRDYKSPGGGSRELRQQLRILKDTLYSIDFISLVPDTSTIQRTSPKLISSCLSAPNSTYLVYLHTPLLKKPEPLEKFVNQSIVAEVGIVLPVGSYSLAWIDTKSGETVKTERRMFDGKSATIQSPRFVDDIALRMVAQQ
jgi:hypothetical protein